MASERLTSGITKRAKGNSSMLQEEAMRRVLSLLSILLDPQKPITRSLFLLCAQ